jgi:hypothetical protein
MAEGELYATVYNIELTNEHSIHRAISSLGNLHSIVNTWRGERGCRLQANLGIISSCNSALKSTTPYVTQAFLSTNPFLQNWERVEPDY